MMPPGSFTISAPTLVPACHTPNAAPVGSAPTNMRPRSPTSPGAIMIVPPFSVTAAAVLSTSSLARYMVHALGRPSGAGPMPAAEDAPTAAIT